MKNIFTSLSVYLGGYVSKTKTQKCNRWVGGYVHLYCKISTAKLSSNKGLTTYTPTAGGAQKQQFPTILQSFDVTATLPV